MPRRLPLLAAALLLGGCEGLLPAALGARMVAPADVGDPGALEIVDLQDATEFAAGHLPGAVRVPAAGLGGYLSRAPARPWRPLLLVCTDGSTSVLGAPTARLHRGDVRVLAGGRDAWARAGRAVERGAAPPVADDAPPLRVLSRAEQVVAWVSAHVLRLLFVGVALLLAWSLRGASDRGLRLLRAGLVVSLAGELLGSAGAPWSRPGLFSPIGLVDGLAMAALAALLPWGTWRLAEAHVLRLADPARRCAVQPLCGRCWKREPVRCALQDVAAAAALGLAVVALAPLTAPLRPVIFRADVLGALVDHGTPVVNHLVELRLYPVLAAALALASIPVLLRARPGALRRAEPLLFGALGLAAYPVLRTLLAGAFRESPPWADFWEELTELLAVATLAVFLLRPRVPLGPSRGVTRDAPPAPASGDAG